MHWWNAGWIIKDEKHAVCAKMAMHPDARCCTSSLGMVLINTAVIGGGMYVVLTWVSCLTRSTHTSSCTCGCVDMCYGQCLTCMTHHIVIATCNLWADVQPSLNTSGWFNTSLPNQWQLWWYAQTSEIRPRIAYMHTHTSGGRLRAGGGGLVVVDIGIKLGTPCSFNT